MHVPLSLVLYDDRARISYIKNGKVFRNTVSDYFHFSKD